MNHERHPQRASHKRPDGLQPDRDPLRPGAPGVSGWRLWIYLMAIFFVASWAFRYVAGGASPARQLTYSEFRQHVADGRVRSVLMKDQRISGEMAAGGLVDVDVAQATEDEAIPPATEAFETVAPPAGDDALLPLLMAQGVEVSIEPSSQGSGWGILLGLLPFVFLVGFFWLMLSRMRTQGQGLFNIGKSKARRYEKTAEHTTFDDVAGVEGTKAELREVIDFLRDPDRYHRLGGSPPKGILLVGPPGSGKTLLARATAGEADVPFFSITGSDFMEMFVGVGASRVRSLFEDARRSSPSIVFIDELDSIGRRRGAGLGGGHDEREQTLNQLLSAMDGFESQEGVIVMAATNRPDILDPALLRPGRFDRHVVVEQGGVQSRLEILRIHARDKPLAADIDLDKVARGTPGFSGADLKNLLNEAALIAARHDKDQIEAADLEEARDKILLGLAREGMDLDDEEWRLIAYHEAGHALVAATLPWADQLQKVAIVPRGRAMGVTQQLPARDRYIHRHEDLAERLVVLLGGRAAERLAFGTATSGAENDLEVASGLARKMVTAWGMGEGLEDLSLGGRREPVFLGEEIAERRPYGEETARRVDAAVQKIVSQASRRADALLRERRRTLDRLAAELMVHEELDGGRVQALIDATDEPDEQDAAAAERAITRGESA